MSKDAPAQTDPSPTADDTADFIEPVVDAPVADDVVNETGGTDAADLSPVEEAPSNEWRAQYESLGFQGVETPEEAQQRLIYAYRQKQEQLAEAAEQVRYMRSLHSRLDQVAHAPVAESPQAAANTDLLGQYVSKWQPPNRDVLARFIVNDERGEPQWRPEMPAELRQQVEQYQLQQTEWQQILADPRQFETAINQRVERLIQDKLEGTLQQRDTQLSDQAAEEQFFSQADWIYAQDPATRQPAYHPITGQPVLSNDGRLFAESLNHVRSLGVTRVADQLDLAMAKFNQVKAAIRVAPAAERAGVTDAVQQQRQQMLGRQNQAIKSQTTAAGVSDAPISEPTGASRMSASRRAILELVEEGMTV